VRIRGNWHFPIIPPAANFGTSGYVENIIILTLFYLQGDHLSGKPGNVREFETCQGNVRNVVNSQGNVMEKNFVMEKCPKTVHY